MITSKLTSKAQTTIPQAVRKALRVGPGDQIAYVIEGDRVLLAKVTDGPFENPFALFTEWASELDKVYDDL